MLDKNIDHLVLGCTLLSFFIPILKEILPEHITIVNLLRQWHGKPKSVFRIVPACQQTGRPFRAFLFKRQMVGF